jgi:hypothetical protein
MLISKIRWRAFPLADKSTKVYRLLCPACCCTSAAFRLLVYVCSVLSAISSQFCYPAVCYPIRVLHPASPGGLGIRPTFTLLTSTSNLFPFILIFSLFSLPKVDWLDGLKTVCGAGSPELKNGLAIHVYAANAPMGNKVRTLPIGPVYPRFTLILLTLLSHPISPTNAPTPTNCTLSTHPPYLFYSSYHSLSPAPTATCSWCPS